MSTKTNSKSKTNEPTAEQIARATARAKAQDERITKANIKNNEALAFGIAELVAKNPHIEWEIVSNYLDRKSKYLVDREETDRAFYAKYPQFDPKKQNKKTATV